MRFLFTTDYLVTDGYQHTTERSGKDGAYLRSQRDTRHVFHQPPGAPVDIVQSIRESKRPMPGEAQGPGLGGFTGQSYGLISF